MHFGISKLRQTSKVVSSYSFIQRRASLRRNWALETVKSFGSRQIPLYLSKAQKASFSKAQDKRNPKKITMFSIKPPAQIDDFCHSLETPALMVDLDILEQNIKQMTESMKAYPRVSFRPHVKAHKCPILARLQMKSGACGVCCQTLTEAEAMVEGGLEDVFISNQVIGNSKLTRLVSLAKQARISVCVDSVENIKAISETVGGVGFNVGAIDLVIEVNVGQNRCGVEPGPDVCKLAEKITSLPHVNFKGVQCYNGWNQHIRKSNEKKAAVDKVADKVKETLYHLKEAGYECNYVTGGGTGTFHFEAASGVFTEVQPGSYIFMDVDYGKNLDDSEQFTTEFKQSLFIVSTVQSVSHPDRAVIDTGLKGVSLDSGVPTVIYNNEGNVYRELLPTKNSTGERLVFHNGGDEHGILRPSGNLKVGDKLKLIPGHCDPTVNMYNWLVGIRTDIVEAVWPITGRGPGV